MNNICQFSLGFERIIGLLTKAAIWGHKLLPIHAVGLAGIHWDFIGRAGCRGVRAQCHNIHIGGGGVRCEAGYPVHDAAVNHI